MNRSVEREINFHVPFQIVEHRTSASDTFYEIRIVTHTVGNRVPMARRCFGAWAVRPKFSEDAHEVAAFDQVRRIRLTCGRIGRVTTAVARSQSIISKRARRNINHHPVVGSKFAATLDDVNDVAAKSIAGKLRRRTGINPRLGRIGSRQCKRPHPKPLCAKIVLSRSRNWKTILIFGPWPSGHWPSQLTAAVVM